MSVIIDSMRGKEVASLLNRSFSTVGIHGRTDMPEDIIPKGVKVGSLEHMMFTTLTVSIDYQRDAPSLWERSRRTFEDPQTRYLFDTTTLHQTPFERIAHDMQTYGLSKKPRKDPYIWKTVGTSFFKKWNGDPRNFLRDCDWDAPKILERLRNDHHSRADTSVPDFPYLRGEKIGPLWIRMLRDNVVIAHLRNLDKGKDDERR